MDRRDPVLEVERLSVSHGEITALRSIDLSVAGGEVVALLGANGAGKSTLIETIIGTNHPTDGSIRFEGREIIGVASDAIVRLGIAVVPEGRGVFQTMSVRDNLLLGRDRGATKRIGIDMVYDLFPILAQRSSQSAGTLSGGEQRMLVIARALMSSPRLVLLDEPSIGLAPRLIESLFSVLVGLPAEGFTILLAEQNAHHALRIADRGYVFDRGRIVHHDSAAGLRGDPRIAEAYLGA